MEQYRLTVSEDEELVLSLKRLLNLAGDDSGTRVEVDFEPNFKYDSNGRIVATLIGDNPNRGNQESLLTSTPEVLRRALKCASNDAKTCPPGLRQERLALLAVIQALTTDTQ